MHVNLTDHEIAFADSPRGRMLIAKARSAHDTREAHRGAAARPWTDAMQTDAIRSLATDVARSTVATSAMLADSARQGADARVARDAAYAARAIRTRDAWRGGR